MQDGGDERGHGMAVPALPTVDDERHLETPNCPDCLLRMEAEESPSGDPYWACTECGLVAIA